MFFILSLSLSLSAMRANLFANFVLLSLFLFACLYVQETIKYIWLEASFFSD